MGWRADPEWATVFTPMQYKSIIQAQGLDFDFIVEKVTIPRWREKTNPSKKNMKETSRNHAISSINK